jgi:hypothetical protein
MIATRGASHQLGEQRGFELVKAAANGRDRQPMAGPIHRSVQLTG